MYFEELNVPQNHIYLFKPQEGLDLQIYLVAAHLWYNVGMNEVTSALFLLLLADKTESNREEEAKPKGLIAKRPGLSCLVIILWISTVVMLTLLARRLWPWLFA